MTTTLATTVSATVDRTTAPSRHVEPVMGTVVSFDLRDPVPLAALDEAIAFLHRADRLFSTYRDDSEVSRLGRGELRLAACDPDVVKVLELCDHYRWLSGGYFAAACNGRLDPSGIVKGWAVEGAGDILSAAGSRRHAVNGGGDIQLAGSPEPGRPWQVGIAHPLRPGHLATVITGCDLAVATSGVAERGHHVVDPRTGRPADALASVTVVGDRLTHVDALATAALAMGHAARDWLSELTDVAAFAVTADGGQWSTAGFPHRR
jgi:thiamine biosynthesis lipoprotein